MADHTRIEWTDASWSPTTGCSPVSEGCVNCWARQQAKRFWPTQYPPVADRSLKTTDLTIEGDPLRARQFSDVMCHEDRLEIPLRWKRPRRIAVSLMGDLFHEAVPDSFIENVVAIATWAPQHTYLVLTKRPERMRALFSSEAFRQMVAEGSPWPLPNVWLGVSCENQARADERIPILLQTPAALRFVSLEPLLGPVDLTAISMKDESSTLWFPLAHEVTFESRNEPMAAPGLDWVIGGGESGPKARPCDIAWICSIVGQCKEAGVPAFVKQLGARPWMEGHASPPVGSWLHHSKGADPSEWPPDLRVREFPEARG